MKIGPVRSNLPASLIEFCRMQRMIAPGDMIGESGNGSGDGYGVQHPSRADWLNRLSSLPDVREDRVERVRSQLEDGTYDADGKLDAAIDHMIDELPLGDLGARIQRPRFI